ncbi:hypothetical protein KUCAC02_034052 [Chaenocephalus aceratus]|nr:hypothetical protein KUCAC02_034052 [Chaenocephalus aceratus]
MGSKHPPERLVSVFKCSTPKTDTLKAQGLLPCRETGDCTSFKVNSCFCRCIKHCCTPVAGMPPSGALQPALSKAWRLQRSDRQAGTTSKAYTPRAQVTY